MVDVFNAVKNRFGIICCQWHHWLPALGYAAVLVTMVAVLGERYPAWTLPSSTGPLSPESVTIGSPAESWPGRAQVQSGNYDGDGVDSHALPPWPIAKEMVALLKEATLWNVDYMQALPQLSTARLPVQLGGLEGEGRKKSFIDALLPTVMVAIHEVRQERQQLLAIIAELGVPAAALFFTEGDRVWQDRLGADKARFILALTHKYRTSSAEELVAMVDVLPPSLIIAQGAIESGWGGSRMATESNNLFGMYSSAGSSLSDGLDGNTGPKIKEYDSILESVRAYVLNINRLPAYKELRRIRSQTLDPMLIAEGLLQYSERKKYYIEDIKHIIALNKLQNYDMLILTAG